MKIGSPIRDLAEDGSSCLPVHLQALLWAALTDEPAHVVAGALRRRGR